MTGVPLAPWTLAPDEPLRRPAQIHPLFIDHVLPRDDRRRMAPLARAIVPVELARPGDRQVVAHRRAEEPAPPLSIDPLAEFPTVSSVVADRIVIARTPLPQIRELFVVNEWATVDQETLANLPGLQSLSLGPGWHAHDSLPGTPETLPPDPAQIDLAVLLDMPWLRHLRFHALAVDSILPLRGMRRLERLRIEGVASERSVFPLASLVRLRWLTLEGWGGLRALGTLTRLEHVDLMDASLASLRAFRAWTQVRRLALSGRGVKTLDGIQVLASLQTLFLGQIGARTLDPLADLPRLRELTLVRPDRVTDFRPLGRLAGLRSLTIRMGTVATTGHLPSIDFLAGSVALEELAIEGALIDDGRLDALMGLPALRRLRLLGNFGDQVTRLRHARPDCLVEIIPLAHAGTLSTVAAGPIEAVELEPGRWAVLLDMSDLPGIPDNFVAHRLVRRAVQEADPQLLERLQFDPDADFVAVYAADEADIRPAAAIIRSLIDARRAGRDR